MSHLLLRILVPTLVGLCTLAPGQRAFAEKRIVVLDIEDAPDKNLRKTIIKIVHGPHEVVASKTFRRTARRMRAETPTSDNLVKVSARLNIDGILSGSVTQVRGRYILRLQLRSGVTGDTVQKLRLRLSHARLSKKIRRQLTRQLMVAINALPSERDKKPEGGSEGDGDKLVVVSGPKARPDKTRHKVKPDKAKPDKKDGETGDGDTTDTGDNTVVATTDRESGNPDERQGSQFRGSGRSGDPDELIRGSRTIESPEAPLRRAVHATLGASVVKRNLTFELAEPFPEAPDGYAGPLAPGLNISGDLYPLELTGLTGSIFAGLGFAFSYDRVIGLQTSIEANGTPTLAPTAQSSYSVGVRLRYRFKGLPTQPTVVLGAGQGRLSFAVDRSQLPAGLALDVPNTSYAFYDPSLSLRLTVHPKVDVTAGGGILLITDAGEVQLPEQYGAATITSYTGRLGVEVRATHNLRVSALGSYTAIDLAFAGNGEQAYLRDGDPTDVDVLSASDRYIGGVLSVGYLY